MSVPSIETCVLAVVAVTTREAARRPIVRTRRNRVTTARARARARARAEKNAICGLDAMSLNCSTGCFHKDLYRSSACMQGRVWKHRGVKDKERTPTRTIDWDGVLPCLDRLKLCIIRQSRCLQS
jgi:hypothetical protein